MAEPSFHFTGVNYTTGTDIVADMAYFKSIKSPNAPFDIRVMVYANSNAIPVPWVVTPPDSTANSGNGNWTYHMQRALTFAADSDFRVVFNMYLGPTTRDKLSGVHDSLISAGLYVQSFGLPMELSLGNELTGTYGILYQGITTLQTAGVATITFPSPFPTHVGDTFTLYNSNRTQYNATHTVIEVVNSNTVKINIDPTVNNNFVNTCSGYNISVVELQQWFCDTAADMKTAGITLPISVGDFNGPVNGVTPYEQWVLRGSSNIGGLDYISVHPYPSATGRPSYTNKFPADATTFLTAFGSKGYISEYNLSGSSISVYKTEAAINNMRDMFAAMDALGVTRAHVWSWDTNLRVKNADGTYHPVWGVLATNNGRIPLAMFNLTRSATSGRTLTSGRTPVTGRTPV